MYSSLALENGQWYGADELSPSIICKDYKPPTEQDIIKLRNTLTRNCISVGIDQSPLILVLLLSGPLPIAG